MKTTTGADDVLGQLSPGLRAGAISKLIETAVPIKKIKKPTKKEEAARVKSKAIEADLQRAAEEGRPMVSMEGDQLGVCNNLQEALDNAYPDVFFWRGGELQMRHASSLMRVDRNRIMALIMRASRTGRPIANPLTEETGWRDEHPSFSTVSAILGDEIYWPKLDGITETPFVRPDGTLCLTTGYDEASRIYLSNTLDVEVPDEPTEEDVQGAVKLLSTEWLGDMLFGGDGDRAMALALMVTPFVRTMFSTAPLFVINGNRPGTGKGLLMEVFGWLALGHPTPLNSLPTEEDEVRKSITSFLLSGANILAWDEVRHVKGRAMAQLLTAPVWSDRVLGASRTAQIVNQATFIVAGNQVRLGGDLFRRVVQIRLETEMERPQDRSATVFRHPNLGAWTSEHRSDLVSAVFTLVRSWVQAGRPSPDDGFGSFEGWHRVVGGILRNAGVPISLEGTREWASEADDEATLWDDHLIWLRQQFGSGPFTVRQVTDKLEQDPDSPVPALQVVVRDVSDRRYRLALGQHYRSQVGTWAGDLTLRSRGKTRERIAIYTVEQREQGEDDVSDVTFTPSTPSGGVSDGQIPALPAEIPASGQGGETRARVHVRDSPLLAGSAGSAGISSPESVPSSSMSEVSDQSLTLSREKNPQRPEGPMTTCTTCTTCKQGGVACTHVRERRGPSETAGISAGIPAGSASLPPWVTPGLLYSRPDAPYRPSAADDVLAGLADEMSSPCPDCNTPEVLVDDLWFACPKCAPATAARGGLK